MASDFRSWLGAKDKYAVQFVGNDGRIDPTKKGYDTMQGSYMNTGGNRAKIQNYVSGLYNQYLGEKKTQGDAQNSAWLAGINAQTAAIRAQTAAMPRLPAFDILGNYNRARTNAEANMRPRYNDMMNQFLESQGVKKTNKQKEVALGKENVELERTNTRSDNTLTRGRTAEDVAAAIQQIGTQEGQFQEDEGREFDVARRGLQEGMAGAGLTTSGIGQQAIATQEADRNTASGRQEEVFEVQRQAKTLFKNRTFEDLQRGDLRADEKAVMANKGYDLDLDSYLSELAQDEKKYKLDWEADLLGAIGEETGRLDREGVMQFINSLAGSGARAQDIAMAKQVYL